MKHLIFFIFFIFLFSCNVSEKCNCDIEQTEDKDLLVDYYYNDLMNENFSQYVDIKKLKAQSIYDYVFYSDNYHFYLKENINNIEINITNNYKVVQIEPTYFYCFHKNKLEELLAYIIGNKKVTFVSNLYLMELYNNNNSEDFLFPVNDSTEIIYY